MSEFYNPKKTSWLYEPKSKAPFKISRSQIDLFIECPQCFYLNNRVGVRRPPGFPFNLNSAVDTLLKKEFDLLRTEKKPHELFEEYNIDAIPFSHSDLDKWRHTFTGIQYLDKETNLLVYGGIDDVWVNPEGELIIVDYKATSKNGEVNLDAEWQIGYKRQMEIYQWLFKKNEFKVSNTGYFVYCNGDTSKEKFDAKLEFDIKIIPYTGDGSWIDEKIKEIKKCLDADIIPEMAPNCDYCRYRKETVLSKMAFEKKYKK